MKRTNIYVAIVISGLVILALLFKYARLDRPETLTSLDSSFHAQLVGVFDRRSSFPDNFSRNIKHISLNIGRKASREQLAQLIGKPGAGNLLVTVVMNGKNDLEEITDGNYDDAIRALCQVLSETNAKTLMRWNPDMEVPVKLYAWQYQSPATYIDAYRHFAAICKEENKAIQLVWAPAGYPGTEEYWPGNDVIDIVSITINGQSENSSTIYARDKDTLTMLRRKLLRTRFTDKPVLILEAGNALPSAGLKRSLADAIAEIEQDSAIVFQPIPNNTPPMRGTKVKPLIGVYDPKELLVSSDAIEAEHIFIDLGDIQSGKFERDFTAITARNHDPVVTVEPWRDRKPRKDSSVLQNTIDGVYDEEFRQLFSIIARSKRRVFVRFAHEMEIPIHRYSWQSRDPVLYIKAYRHFMSLSAGVANVKKVWGPAGDRGSMEWYPGNDAVDYVSIAIYGLPDKDITDPTKQEPFEAIYNRKLQRVRFAGKPIFVTEFGVKGPEDYQQQWMEGVASLARKHGEIFGLCYFNLADNPKVWGNIPPPDWGISRATFDHFVAELLPDGR